MAWRELIIDSICKVSCLGNYLVVRCETTQRIHLSEISVIIIANTAITITGVALCEIVKHKINIIFCDEKRNPYSQLLSFYGTHNSAKKLSLQLNWDKNRAQMTSDQLIYTKIINQSKLLNKYGFNDRALMLKKFAGEMVSCDETNREGHAAKVYFNTLFGNEFTRDSICDINIALNYGYTILLSCINREIVSNGCLTQIGLHHKNEFNNFNLSCDIIEPYRVIIDEFVFINKDKIFDKSYKYDLINLLNKDIFLDCNTTVLNALNKNVKEIIDFLSGLTNQIPDLYNFL